ncbi:MAG: hypothetical protein CL489_10245 [Acidobacteria bacterium]|nr:hypothetical protein [Acidobacteriota bacterium]|tara:strand:+ start:5681 stop:6016 length:336 start_codon:yes stop_codon:yes gene_type:complete
MIWCLTGSRDLTDRDFIYQALDKRKERISKIIVGDADGVDALVIAWCVKNDIPFEVYYRRYESKSAYKRNGRLAKDCDITLALYSGNTRGTNNTVYQVAYLNKIVEYEYYE